MTIHADRSTPVRVLLVEDSAVERRIIERFLQQAEGIEVVGTATNGQEALEQISKLHPDVVCTDYHMPVMDGMELTRRIMAEDPRPVLVLSISIQPDQEHNIMKMYEVGAIEVMARSFYQPALLPWPMWLMLCHFIDLIVPRLALSGPLRK
jgi:two-component system chemotaxis response regulator CheB